MLPKTLKELRKQNRLTQVQIAQTLKIAQSSYADWERGKTKPSQEKLKNLASFFGVSIDYLLGETDIKNPSEVDESKLDDAIDKSLGYNGKPVTDEERESIKEVLRTYLESLSDK